MVLKCLRFALVAGAVLGGSLAACAQDYITNGPVEPYANFYAYGNPTARLYVTPLPTPPLVGHTYITYPPLAPQEYLYHHDRHYLGWHPDSGWTSTHVHWNGCGSSQAFKRFLIGPQNIPCRGPLVPPLNDTQLRLGPN